jgi:hypothetical protein
MRTTLEIDDEILAVAKDIARRNGATLGQVISQLARQSLSAQPAAKVRNGVRVLASSASGAKPDLRLVNELRD